MLADHCADPLAFVGEVVLCLIVAAGHFEPADEAGAVGVQLRQQFEEVVVVGGRGTPSPFGDGIHADQFPEGIGGSHVRSLSVVGF